MDSIDIPIQVTEPTTGMAQAIFNELAEHLQQLVDLHDSHTIDLMSLPINDSDKQELENLLGKGEVEVNLSTVGESKIYETSYSGIWWVRHYGADEGLISEFIEVTWIPEIIKSHPMDAKQSVDQMKQQIHIEKQGNNDERGNKE